MASLERGRSNHEIKEGITCNLLRYHEKGQHLEGKKGRKKAG